jgi:ATP-dependent protease ClpP protease subunit
MHFGTMRAGKGASVAPMILRSGCRQTRSVIENAPMLVAVAGMARGTSMS